MEKAYLCIQTTKHHQSTTEQHELKSTKRRQMFNQYANHHNTCDLYPLVCFDNLFSYFVFLRTDVTYEYNSQFKLISVVSFSSSIHCSFFVKRPRLKTMGDDLVYDDFDASAATDGGFTCGWHVGP